MKNLKKQNTRRGGTDTTLASLGGQRGKKKKLKVLTLGVAEPPS